MPAYAGTATCRSDAGNDLERYARVGQRRCFFTAAPEHKRIAALQSNDFIACTSVVDE
jgi:hypothetical protein